MLHLQAGGDPSTLLEQLDASIRRHPRVVGSGTTQAVRLLQKLHVPYLRACFGGRGSQSLHQYHLSDASS